MLVLGLTYSENIGRVARTNVFEVYVSGEIFVQLLVLESPGVSAAPSARDDSLVPRGLSSKTWAQRQLLPDSLVVS